ncbi:hypothetical protein, partial [Cupriavidus metallidurans]|uniref:hypothetical protein n=1 Tax=Cupriavidus metallidurans TaxID=119219 RepID=UPI001BE03D68
MGIFAEFRVVLADVSASDAARSNRAAKAKPPAYRAGGFGYKSLAMTYFHTGSPHYHRREVVSQF